MAEEEGSGPEEEGNQKDRRVKPLLRFMRRKGDEPDEGGQDHPDMAAGGPPDEGEGEVPHRVRPVRVVKFVPPDAEEESPFAEVPEEEPFTEVQEEAPFAEAPEEQPFAEVPEEEPFAEAPEEQPFAEVPEEQPFAEVPEEQPFAEVPEEQPFAEVPEEQPFAEAPEEQPFAEAPEEQPFAEAPEEQPFAEVPEERPFAEAPEEQPFAEVPEDGPFAEENEGTSVPDRPVVPEIPFDELRDADEESAVDRGLTEQEDREVGIDMGFREEETPIAMEGPRTKEAPPTTHPPPEGAPGGTTPGTHEERPAYHKYLRPDAELLERRPVKGRPTGFDRDLETDAGEIDLGIDLIDPSERKKKTAPPKPRKDQKLPKGAVGGHDFDGEVGTRELGVDIGVDYEKRRKRRL